MTLRSMEQFEPSVPRQGKRKFFNPRCAGFIGETGRPVGSRE